MEFRKLSNWAFEIRKKRNPSFWVSLVFDTSVENFQTYQLSPWESKMFKLSFRMWKTSNWIAELLGFEKIYSELLNVENIINRTFECRRNSNLDFEFRKYANWQNELSSVKKSNCKTELMNFEKIQFELPNIEKN